MIKHIVFFKLKKAQDAPLVQKALQGLKSKITGLVSLEIGINFSKEQRSCDIALITGFKTIQDLESYAIHPEHLKAIAKIKEKIDYTKVVDYELN